MYRRIMVLATLVLASLTATPPSWAATVNVVAGGAAGLVFTPHEVHVHPGDTVIWTNGGGLHSVTADDGSFGNTADTSAWTVSHTFSTVGTVGYHCEEHGSPGHGMFGTVVVEDAGGGGGSHPGTLGFSLANFSVNEGAGTATLAVQRTGGADGAVSVAYAATAGTATAGQDFTSASGTLSWADQDGSTKTFTVTVINDTNPEPTETVLLALSNPTGGAVLDAAHKNATLSIQDNDSGGGGGGPVKAPSNLQAVAHSTSEIDLTWTDNSTNETGFSVERRTVGGTYEVVATVSANTTSAPVSGLDPASFSLFRVRATGSSSSNFSPYSAEIAAATLADPGACVAGANALCLNNGRFKATIDFHATTSDGHGSAVPLPAAPDSGLFYFFNPTNIEMLIKVLNACVAPFNHYWVFFAATTNVEFDVVVTDTQTGKTKTYYNPLNQAAAPIQDINAFATCP
ncbi:MAG TPA: Calx-beta domain-containing protein [Thermoanaerobaculia bacterium]